MNLEAILGIVTKGLTVVGSLVEAGQAVQPTISKLIDITSKGTSVTQTELDELEKSLDAQLAELEAPMPEDI